MYKIEKRYMLKSSVTSLIKELKLSSTNVALFYTDISACKSTSFEKSDTGYKKIVKKGLLSKAHKNNKDISKKVYLKQKSNSIGDLIEKKRYFLSKKSSKLFIDIYLNKLEGLYILEVEYLSKKELLNFQKSNIFKNYVIKDVTKEKRYQSSQLAILGNPSKNSYDIYTLFKDIELGRDIKLNKIIFKEMKTSDAVRLLLYKEFVDLRVYRDLILEHKGEKGFKKFESSLKNIVNLIQEYKNIFDKKSINIIIKNYKLIKSSFKVHNDLNYIKKELITINPLMKKSEFKKIQKSIKEKIDIEKRNIGKLLKSRSTSIALKQLELIIKENNKSFISPNSQLSISNSNKKRVKNHYEKIVQKCEKYDSCDDVQSYKSMKKSTNRLKMILQKFKMILNSKNDIELEKLQESIKRNLTDIENAYKNDMILKVYLASLEKKSKGYDDLLEKYKHKSLKNGNKYRKELNNNFKILKNKKNIFK